MGASLQPMRCHFVKILLGVSTSYLFLAGPAAAQIKVDARLHTLSGSCASCDLSNKTMTRMQLQNADFSGSFFNRSNLSGGKFDNSNLSATHFRRAYLVGVSGEKVNFESSVLTDATLIEAKLTQSNLRLANLSRADMTRGEFQNNIFNDTKLISVSAEEADFTGSYFINARIDHIDLKKANLSQTIMQGVKFGNALLTDTKFDGADLSGADLRSASNLTQAQLDTACGSHKTRLPTGMSIMYCLPAADTMTKHLESHFDSERPPYINRAAEDLDDALKSIETLLSTSDKPSRRSLQAIHADVMAARDALEAQTPKAGNFKR